MPGIVDSCQPGREQVKCVPRSACVRYVKVIVLVPFHDVNRWVQLCKVGYYYDLACKALCFFRAMSLKTSP